MSEQAVHAGIAPAFVPPVAGHVAGSAGVHANAQYSVTRERCTLVTVTGTVHALAVATLRMQLDAAVGQPETEVVAVDLSSAARSDPGLFEVLARSEAGLRARHSRLVIIGIHPEVLASLDDLDETHLPAVFTLYRAVRDRVPAAMHGQPSDR